MIWFVQDFKANGKIILDDIDKTIVIEACYNIKPNAADNDGGYNEATTEKEVDEEGLVTWFQNWYSLL